MTEYLNVRDFMHFLMGRLGEMGMDPSITWDFVDGVIQITCTMSPAVLNGHVTALIGQLQEETNLKEGS